MPPELLWLLGYFIIGLIVAALYNCYSDYKMNADYLAAIHMFWPLCVLDLVYRMIRGRWFGDE